MSILPVIILVVFVTLVMYFMLNKKTVEHERNGVVKDILNKDAISVEFEDGQSSVVKFFGLTPASESEMLDDKIAQFFDDKLRGTRVSVKPHSVGAGDVIVGEVRVQSGEYVNAVLVRQGFARWAPIEASGDNELFEAQEKAKSEQLGIWNPAVRQLVEDRMRMQSTEDISSGDVGDSNTTRENK